MDVDTFRRPGEPAAVPADTLDAVPCFDCNICMECAADPVVTLCGHLYCWPCAYQWLHSDRPASGQCPVCKAAISETCLVPLYGRGLSAGAAKRKGFDIPRRPSLTAALEHRRRCPPRQDAEQDFYFDIRPVPRHGYYGGADLRSWSPVFHSNAGCVIGDVAAAVLPWAFRDEASALQYSGLYGAPLVSDGRGRRPSWRLRQVESSLQQIWMFLAITAVLCFLLL